MIDSDYIELWNQERSLEIAHGCLYTVKLTTSYLQTEHWTRRDEKKLHVHVYR